MSIRRNTFINLAGAIVPMAVMLVTVPLYLKVLGEARYGVLALVWLVLGYFSFLDMGLGKATSNRIAKADHSTNEERSEIFWSALAANATMGALAAGVLWFASDYFLVGSSAVPDDLRQEVRSALPWLIASFPLALVSSVLNGALEGRSKFLIVNLLQISTSTAFQLIPLGVALTLGGSLAHVIPAAVLTRAAMSLLFLHACYRHVQLVGAPQASIATAKSLFNYGGWIALTGVLTPLLDTIERFFIGAILGATAVTHYTVPMQVAGKVKILPGSLSRTLFPVFSSGDHGDSRRLAAIATTWLAVVMALAALLAALGLRPFLEIWVGAEIARISAPIGELLLIGVWINSVAHVPYFLLQASGRPDLVAKVHVLELVPYLAISWTAITAFGLIGAAYAWVFRCLVEALALLLMARFSARVWVYLATAAASVITGIGYLSHYEADELVWRFGIALPFTLGLVALMWALPRGVHPGETRGA